MQLHLLSPKKHSPSPGELHITASYKPLYIHLPISPLSLTALWHSRGMSSRLTLHPCPLRFTLHQFLMQTIVVLRPVPTFPLVVSIPSKATHLQCIFAWPANRYHPYHRYHVLTLTYAEEHPHYSTHLVCRMELRQEETPCSPRPNAALNRLLVTPLLSCSVE